MNGKILTMAGRVSAKLSDDQSATLEKWLFEESPPLTYGQARERLEREQGTRLSMGAITGFFQRRARERMLAQAAASGRAGDAAWGSLERAEAHRVLMEAAGRLGFDLAVNGEKLTLRELTRLTQLAAAGLAAERAAKRVRLMERETEIRSELLALKKRLVALKERAEARRVAKREKEECDPDTRPGAARHDDEVRPAMAA